MTKVSFEEGNARLLQLADLLETIPAVHPEGNELRGYDQAEIIHPCGSPACAWGHWLLADPVRAERIFAEAKENFLTGEIYMAGEDSQEIRHRFVYTDQAQYEFSLDNYEEIALFSAHGCRGAKTGAEAAAYIREFVARRVSAEAA